VKNYHKIVIIGSGNVATVLGKALKKKGFTIVQVYGRKRETAKKLSHLLNCAFVTKLSDITLKADLYIIAVKDDAISGIASSLKLKSKTVVHTSGSIPMDVLKGVSECYGVLYPVHGFNKNEPLNAGIPFCIESANRDDRLKLERLVRKLKGKPFNMNSVQRAKLHLAAVFANNFTNHLWYIADTILSDARLPFELLVALAADNLNKLKSSHPAQHQTGPAIRKDTGVMKKHEQMLKKYPAEFGSVYKLLSKSIQAVNKERNHK
jgi:predicted short-subunit dehydrogenase-like oxidoreductase (DUF2520 family)